MTSPIDTCAVFGCGIKRRTRGLCPSHYQRWRRHGDPLAGGLPAGAPFEDRYWSKVDKSGRCWLWTGAKNDAGYGQISVGGKMVYAHRLSLEMSTGSTIPPGMDVDHMCHTRHCVNPNHLRLATRKQNLENRRTANSSSKSGIRGVSYSISSRRYLKPWLAQVRSKGQATYSGYFSTKEEAAAAVVSARLRMMTHSQED
ncbi:HNH endonuclease signature motif containing protein [Mycobacteroides abscessus]|uniref:HNH endonuclease signature motif containing protein n=1 Tax=Mycobacteroides abscessus TaxID=36809 RepID=UPI000C25ECA8